MKLSSVEEYGLRCLLQIGRRPTEGGLTIPEISKAEGISTHNAAKMMRILRRGGLVKANRGQSGGYSLARAPEDIAVGEVLAALGDRLYDPTFCDRHAGMNEICTHTVDCSIRSLWSQVQLAVDEILNKTTLRDLLGAVSPEGALIRKQEIAKPGSLSRGR